MNEYIQIGNTIYKLDNDGVHYHVLENPSLAIIERCKKGELT